MVLTKGNVSRREKGSMRLKRSIFLMVLLMLGFCFMNCSKIAIAAESEDSMKEAKQNAKQEAIEDIIYITSVEDETYGIGVDLPSKVKDNSKVKKIVLPKDIRYILADYRYEVDSSLMQNYKSITPNCPNLLEVEVDPENPNFTVVDGILYSKNLKFLYYCPPGKKGAIVLPDEVEVIHHMAFQECSQITSITFSTSLTTIYEGAFGGNIKLSQLIVPSENPNFIVKSNVLLSSDGEVLYLYAQGKKSTKYIIPYGVRRINGGSFMGNKNLQYVYVPGTVRSIGIEAFEKCTGLSKVKLNEGLLEIEGGAFFGCSKLNDLVFPKGLLFLHQYAIKGCRNLLNLTIPESLQKFDLSLDEVKNRVVYCYNLYNFDWHLSDKNVIKSMTVYVYKGSRIASYVEELGVSVKYITPSNLSTSAVVKAPKSAVKGTGKPDTSWYDPKKSKFSIKNPDQLAGLAKLVDQNKNMSGKTFILERDLDLSCYPNWMPIGCSNNKYRIFKGNFDGKNHTIYNLRIHRLSTYDSGLFGFVNGKISNLNIEDADVIGYTAVGILCGETQGGSFVNCTVSGKVRGNEYVGGLVGSSNSDISNCISTVCVYGNLSVGGLTGDSRKKITGCQSKGDIFGYETTGGISGSHGGIIIDSVNTAIVDGYLNVGGIVGVNDGSIKSCINSGFINGFDCVGGIAGAIGHKGTITESNNLYVD